MGRTPVRGRTFPVGTKVYSNSSATTDGQSEIRLSVLLQKVGFTVLGLKKCYFLEKTHLNFR